MPCPPHVPPQFCKKHELSDQVLRIVERHIVDNIKRSESPLSRMPDMGRSQAAGEAAEAADGYGEGEDDDGIHGLAAALEASQQRCAASHFCYNMGGNGSSDARHCGSRWFVSGVAGQFRAPPPSACAGAPTSRSERRSWS